MFATYITDCRDANARMRLTISAQSFLNVPALDIVGVQNDVQAAFNLVDALSVSSYSPRIIFVNVAPRGGSNKERWPNGSPFGWFNAGNNLVLTTIEGLTLSLLERCLGFRPDVRIFNIKEDVHQFPHLTSEEEREAVVRTQFRSLEFLIPAAQAVQNRRIEGHDHTPLTDIATMEPHVGWVDCFGNLKLTVLQSEASWYEVGRAVNVTVGSAERRAVCYPGLSHIPDRQIGVVPGSSGLGANHFMEVMVGHGSAAKAFLVPDDEPTPSVSISPIE